MRKLASLVLGIFIMSFSVNAASVNSEENTIYSNYGKSYIFVVENVEFSVFPDGQFDFTYIGYNNNTSVTLSTANVNINYNSGYNYDMYVQYDNYGAIIQVENVPVYYDEFGRIAQVGDVEILYSNRRIVRVGGLYVHYNYYGYYSHHTGYINPLNYYYVYRPWHSHYVRPVYASCVVYDYPYRRYYSPIRYNYNDHYNYYSNRGRSNIAYTNGRRSFHRPGSRVHYKGGRSVANKDYKPNQRNTAVTQTTRRDKSVSKRNKTTTVNRTSKRSEKVALGNSSSSNTRRIASSTTTRSDNRKFGTTATKKVSYQRNTSNKKNNSSTTIRNKKETSKSYRSNTNKGNSTTRVANTSQRNSSKKNKTKAKGASSTRRRGL